MLTTFWRWHTQNSYHVYDGCWCRLFLQINLIRNYTVGPPYIKSQKHILNFQILDTLHELKLQGTKVRDVLSQYSLNEWSAWFANNLSNFRKRNQCFYSLNLGMRSEGWWFESQRGALFHIFSVVFRQKAPLGTNWV